MQQSSKNNTALCALFLLVAVALALKLISVYDASLTREQGNLTQIQSVLELDEDVSRSDHYNIFSHNTGPVFNVFRQNIALQSLIRRVVGEELAEKFNVTVISDDRNDKESFRIFKKGDSLVQISGNTISSAAAGFHHYLKHYLKCHISWDYDQCLLSLLPDVNVQVVFPERFRLFSNVCTASYTYVWWDWIAWERELDRWALTGINLAYAATGMESVWAQVCRDLGMSDGEIAEHFAGPGFLAWNRMGNVRGWGGPLSFEWHQKQAILQRRILARMRELGITPILPAFAGIVPVAFKRLFPNANLLPSGKWCHFEEKYCCPLFLDPTDELFAKIGSKYLKELKAQFGTDHVYSADSFNENLPPSGDVDYLSKAAHGIYQAISGVDPNATWVLQGWTFVNERLFWTEERVKAFLTAVPLGKILVLDLFAEQMPSHERLHSYYGQPYVWCMLHNFGGTLGMHGSLPMVNAGVARARNQSTSLVGLGIVPEGLNQNFVVYDFMSDLFLLQEINISAWTQQYTRRRYGAETDGRAVEAWQLLSSSVYSYTGSLGALHGQYKISTRPSLVWKPEIWYEPVVLFKAWTLLLNSSQLMTSPNYRYDVVDLTRQVLQVIFFQQFEQMLAAFQANDLANFSSSSEKMIRLLNDLEEILASERKFLLGVWLKSAQLMGSNALESHLFEFNARNQITLWGPNGEIVDYATKQWSGIVSSYFLPRWSLFFIRLNDSLTQDVPFNETEFKLQVLDQVEQPFGYSLSPFPSEPIGNARDIAMKIHHNWFSQGDN